MQRPSALALAPNIEGLRHDVPLRPKRAPNGQVLSNHLRAADRNDGNRLEPVLMPLQDKTAEKMLNNVADFIATTLAKPDQRAWDQLLIYCPREAVERRLAALPGPLSKGKDFKTWWERGLPRS